MIVPWRFFRVTVARLEELSPSFLRVTVTGEDLASFADNGYDQRIKLVLPLPGSGLAHMPDGLDWFEQWRRLPDGQRNPVRTYTVRAVRPEASEVDIDMVLHPGGDGPAIRWAREAAAGGEVMLLGPDAGYTEGPHGGIDFHLPGGTRKVLIGGDETAVPAIAAILERLPSDVEGEVVLEVPFAADVLTLAAPEGVRIGWHPRDGAGHGEALVPAFQEAARRVLGSGGTRAEVLDVNVDEEILWEVPEEGSSLGGTECYAWLAGEAGAIKTLRRYLVTELGADRRAVAFMGYWRMGRSEN
ncbi:siderophore-interacting protein [Longispora albida]|uniref:siderophore-interacting protein n=1 Tax=Longispora albida TaxID=203523 RepID=UPI00039AF06E|nr:siderophore-interacting protein [Longispora albida]